MGKKIKECKIGIHNRFDVEVVDVNTGEIIQRAQGFNVICNTIYNYLCGQQTTSGNADGYGMNIAFGSGSGTPSASDTALFSRVGSKSAGIPSMSHDRDNHIITYSRNITISNTEYVGSTFSEVGLSPNGTLITTHSVLQDMNGNPITIEHTSTDIIHIYSNVYVHYGSTLGNFDLVIGTPYRQSTGPGWNGGNLSALLGGYAGRLYYYVWSITRLTNVFYTYSNNNNITYRDFISGGSIGSVVGDTTNKTLTINFNQLSVGSFNATDLSGSESGHIGNDLNRLTFSDGSSTGNARFTFDVPTKSSVLSESVGVGDGQTTKFKTKFSFPENATVYVNGVQATGVQVLKASITTYANVEYSHNWDRWTPYLKQVTESNGIVYNSRDIGVASTNGAAVVIWENELSSLGMGMTAWTGSVSNDIENWTDVNGTLTDEQKRSKYYRGAAVNNKTRTTDYDGNNVIFTTPPADGDVITIDYETYCIPKDTDHVLDISITFSFGEYQGA